MDRWKELIEGLGSGEISIATVPSDELGRLRRQVNLPNGYRLHVTLLLEFRSAPVMEKYTLQLLNAGGECVLRYDNARHHTELPGAPHHLHRGDAVFPVIPEPSLRVMLAAIRDELDRRS